MSEIKITLNSLENAILKDGLFVSGKAYDGEIIASGTASHAEGITNYGMDLIAKGLGAHAEGLYTKAFGEFSHVEGGGWPLSATSYELSSLTSSAGKTTCILGSSLTLNTCNIYLGSIIKFSDNNGSTKYSVVSSISGSNSFTVNNTIDSTFTTILVHVGASGYGSHAEGNSTLASGMASHTEGELTRALGLASHAEGIGTSATGTASHAGGRGTVADQEAMTAIGKYNLSTNTSNTLFVVGDGTTLIHSDAFRVNSLGSSITSLTPSSVQAKVNNVSDVYLGCPIGTVVMWPGTNAPEGWYVCNGEEIWNLNEKPSSSTSPYASPTALYGDTYKNLYNALVDYTYWYYTCRIDGALYYWMYDHLWIDGRNNIAFPIGYSRTQLNENNIKPIATTYSNFAATQIRRLPDFRANFAIGYDANNPYGTSLNPTGIGYYGGEATHKLTAAESGLPAHEHTYLLPNVADDNTTGGQSLRRTGNTSTETTGGNGRSAQQAHNNIPPYLVINFIIKYK